MGTNYYFYLPDPLLRVLGLDWNARELHVGKMSNAGPFCTACHQTLAVGGTPAVEGSPGLSYHDQCPACGASALLEPDDGLSWHEPRFEADCIRRVCSFTWAVSPSQFRQHCINHPEELIACEGTAPECRYRGREMLAILAACPLEFLAIGEEFT